MFECGLTVSSTCKPFIFRVGLFVLTEVNMFHGWHNHNSHIIVLLSNVFLCASADLVATCNISYSFLQNIHMLGSCSVDSCVD